jgi:hypothetical protein
MVKLGTRAFAIPGGGEPRGTPLCPIFVPVVEHPRPATGVLKCFPMTWGRIAVAILASGFLSSMTDWLFMGDWLYKRHDPNPEIWRYPAGQGETKAILWSSLLPFLTCGVFILACRALHLKSSRETLELAGAIWLIGPLPLTIVNALWIKFAPALAAFHALGWLIKLILAATAVALIVG